MKKTLSVILAVIMAFSLFTVMASAAGTNAVAFNIGGDLNDSFKASIEEKGIAVDVAYYDTASSAYVSGDDTYAVTVRYDATRFPDLSAITAGLTFEFDLGFHSAIDGSMVYITYDEGEHELERAASGLYAIAIDADYAFEIDNATVKAFAITNANYPIGTIDGQDTPALFASKEGFEIYSYHDGDVNDLSNKKAYWGDDYWFSVVVKKGYRNCLEEKDRTTSDSLADSLAEAMTMKVYTDEGWIINNDKDARYPIYYSGSTGCLYSTGDDYCDVEDMPADAVICGYRYRIPGNYVKNDIAILVNNCIPDSKYYLLNILFKILNILAAAINRIL